MIVLELVPTNLSELLDQSQFALSTYHQIKGINIPDILRVNNRSYTAAEYLAKQHINAIPHIRTCDFSMDQLIALCENLEINNVTKILLISGDPSPNPLHVSHTHNMINVIKELSTSYPNIKFYAGHDPYRTNLKDEINYSEQKLMAGAKGLFTQPIFNPHLAKLTLEQCQPCEWYIGISPVLNNASFNYWVNRNNVLFPPNFELTLDHNITIAKKIIRISKKYKQNNYIMPIKTNLNDYLPGIFND